jgi:hypothetical protein
MNSTPVKDICTYSEACIICGGQIERVTNTSDLREKIEKTTGAVVLEIIINHCDKCSQSEFSRIMSEHAKQ